MKLEITSHGRLLIIPETKTEDLFLISLREKKRCVEVRSFQKGKSEETKDGYYYFLK